MENFKHNLVFIVEDNEMYSLMMDYVLSNECNYHFMSFKTGEECLENLYLKPSVVVLDYHLPGMDGKEVFLQIRKYDPKISVIILTSDHDAEVERQFTKAGVADYLVKSEDSVSQLRDSIDEVLAKKNKVRSLFHLGLGGFLLFIVLFVFASFLSVILF